MFQPLQINLHLDRGGGGQVVSVLAFSSDDLSSNYAESTVLI